MKNKWIWGLVVIVVIVAGAWYLVPKNNPTSAPKTTKIKVADVSTIFGLPFYMAIEKGYFKEAGLDVELVRLDSVSQVVDSTMNGQVEFGSVAAIGTAAVADFKNPGKANIFMIAGGDKIIPNDTLIVKMNSGIKSINDLKGKKLGIFPGLQTKTISKYILEQNGLVADKDVQVIELAPSLQIQALGSGQVDALYTVEPLVTVAKQKGLGTELIHAFTAEYISDPFYGVASLVNTNFAKNNPETVAKFIEVINRSTKEIEQNPESARQYLLGYTQVDKTLVSFVPILKFKLVNNLSPQDMASAQKLLDIYSNYKIVDGKMDFQKLLYSSTSK